MTRAQVGEGFVEFTADDARYQRTANRVAQTTERLGRRFEAAGRLARRMLFVSAAAIAGLVKLAADAEESESRFRAVFRGSAEDVKIWSEALARGVGRSRIEIRDAAATFQGFFVGLGFASDRAVELSKKMVELGIDFASFNNLTDDDALRRFISALSGSAEVLDRFGVITKAAALDQQLFTMGIEGGVRAATEQQKVIARLEIIMSAMGNQGAMGDAVRTAGSLTNQMRALRGEIRDTGVDIGNIFAPEVLRLLSGVRSLLPVLERWVAENREQTLVTTKMVFQLLIVVAVLPKVTRLIAGLIAMMTTLRGVAFSLIGVFAGLIALTLADELRRINIEIAKQNTLLAESTQRWRDIGAAMGQLRGAETLDEQVDATRAAIAALDQELGALDTRIAAIRTEQMQPPRALGLFPGFASQEASEIRSREVEASNAEKRLAKLREQRIALANDLLRLEGMLTAQGGRALTDAEKAAANQQRKIDMAREFLDLVEAEAAAAARSLRNEELRRRLDERRAADAKGAQDELGAKAKAIEEREAGEAAGIVAATRTQDERLKAELARLRDFLSRGLIDEDTFRRAGKAARQAAAPAEDRGGGFIGLQQAFRSIQSQVFNRDARAAEETARNTGQTVTELKKAVIGIDRFGTAIDKFGRGVPAVLT